MFEFDLIIIGAGINGAGVARDAAMRGLKVLLLDKGDLGGGTSSWSTRLIHGGLRYLEHGEFGLVRESLRERETLLRIAPHLVRPLPLLFPIYQHARRGRLSLRLGMIAYDLLSVGKALPGHRMLSRAEALTNNPGLRPEGLRGAALYYDAQAEFPERLVVENALAALEHGARVITHASVERLIIDNEQLQGVKLSTGQLATASIIINATGPWVDRILESADAVPRLIGGTKGSHIVVAPFTSAPETAVYIEAKSDQRPFFIIPWNNNYLIGTTDIRYEGDLDNVRIDETELEYLLRETNGVLPSANLHRNDVLFSYSGVRPLPFTTKTDEQSITRRHFIRVHPRYKNLFSLVGGKLTTYRSLAEETVNLVLSRLGKHASAASTASAALPGAAVEDFKAFGERFKTECGLGKQTSEHLLRVYGSRAVEIERLATGDQSLREVFDDETGAIAAEVVYAFKEEYAQTLGDCLLRRTMVGLNSSLGVGADEVAARIAQHHLDWSEQRVRSEVNTYRQSIARFHDPKAV